MEILGFAAILLGMVGLLGYCVFFVWASFHTRPEISQARALFVSWTALDSSNYTERGQQILRRMWFSLAAGVLLCLLAIAIGAATDGTNPSAPGESASTR